MQAERARRMAAEALGAHRQVAESLAALEGGIMEAAAVLVACYRSGGKTLIMGNGGSAADSQHFAAELVGRYKRERKGLPSIALTTDTSALTAISNDYGYADVFARQVEAHARPGDVVVGISTSGHSENVARGLAKARELGAKSILLSGGDGGRLRALSDLSLLIPSKDTPRIQEGHITLIHILCDIVEIEMAGDDGR